MTDSGTVLDRIHSTRRLFVVRQWPALLSDLGAEMRKRRSQTQSGSNLGPCEFLKRSRTSFDHSIAARKFYAKEGDEGREAYGSFVLGETWLSRALAPGRRQECSRDSRRRCYR